MNHSFLLEACVETFAQAQKAEHNGAHLIELCDRLDLDGLTPSVTATQSCLSSLKIPVKTMIRSREGDFIYNSMDVALMQKQILELKKIGIMNFVIGAVTPENKIDTTIVKALSETAGDVSLTFHKAFDLIVDWREGIDQLLAFKNVTHILTSGGTDTALEGSKNLIDMINYSAGRITIIPAGKITSLNVSAIHDLLQATHYHGRKIV